MPHRFRCFHGHSMIPENIYHYQGKEYCRICRRNRGRKHKLLVKEANPAPTVVQKFFHRVEKTDTCWLWRGSLRDGYGIFYTGVAHVRAHRWLYFQLKPNTDPNFVIDHICCVKDCVNPAHLQAVTIAENTKLAALRRRAVPQVCHTCHVEFFVKKYGELKYCEICTAARHRAYRRVRAAKLLQQRKAAGLHAPVGAYKTHCKWGHDYVEENLYFDKNGNRSCLLCRTKRAAENSRRTSLERQMLRGLSEIQRARMKQGKSTRRLKHS
jgi:hypothetical protein